MQQQALNSLNTMSLQKTMDSFSDDPLKWHHRFSFFQANNNNNFSR